MNPITRSSRMRAFEALEALLMRTSAIKLKDVDLGPVGEEFEVDIVAHIEVLGHGHTLVCQLAPDGEPQHVKNALETLRYNMRRVPGDVTPVIVVPCLSQEARELCRENNAGFLDLHGNGCLAFGEVFISMRSSPSHAVFQASVAATGTAKVQTLHAPLKKFPPARADSPTRGTRVGRHATSA